jgi:hypothetical protein
LLVWPAGWLICKKTAELCTFSGFFDRSLVHLASFPSHKSFYE